jgi:hypothetical protein
MSCLYENCIYYVLYVLVCASQLARPPPPAEKPLLAAALAAAGERPGMAAAPKRALTRHTPSAHSRHSWAPALLIMHRSQPSTAMNITH